MRYRQLRDFLLQFPIVTEVLGTRIYAGGLLPRDRQGQISGELPAATTTLVLGPAHVRTDSVGCYRPVNAQIDFWGTDLDLLEQIAQTVRGVLEGYKGAMADMPVGGVFTRQWPPPHFENDVNLWRFTTDYEIHTLGG